MSIELRTEIERTLAAFRVEDLCRDLMRSGVPAGPVNTVPQAFAQPHVAHRRMLTEGDGHRAAGVPVKLGQTPGRPGGRPPRLGEHARQILAEAGLDEGAIADLFASGVVAGPPAPPRPLPTV